MGDPDHFPTYYNCRKVNGEDDQLSISYFLFYPFDYKGNYTILSIEPGKHRGDWEGVNVVIKGITDFTTLSEVENTEIERVFYGGHGHPKYLTPSSNGFHAVGNHTQVFVSWGSHTCYPEPGSWHDWVVDGIVPNWYDDQFNGRGLAVQSWHTSRELINVGERNNGNQQSFVGWLNFKGCWGPDDNDLNGSPSGPTRNSFWGYSLQGRVTWEYAKDHWDEFWENPFSPYTLMSPWYSHDGPKVIFSNDDDWQNTSLLLGPGEYPDLVNDYFNLLNNVGVPKSLLFLGDVEVTLYPEFDFMGTQITYENSQDGIPMNAKSMKIKSTGNSDSYVCGLVVDGEDDGTIIQIGNWLYPYHTVEEGANEIEEGGNLCIKSGYFPENITISKPMTMRAFCGSVIIGD